MVYLVIFFPLHVKKENGDMWGVVCGGQSMWDKHEGQSIWDKHGGQRKVEWENAWEDGSGKYSNTVKN